jgi:hypothetical protein
MKAAKLSLLDDDATAHHRAFDRTLFTESQMGARAMVFTK